jgi:hypothetical protein
MSLPFGRVGKIAVENLRPIRQRVRAVAPPIRWVREEEAGAVDDILLRSVVKGAGPSVCRKELEAARESVSSG